MKQQGKSGVDGKKWRRYLSTKRALEAQGRA
jgi:hypothetical protein